MKHSSRYERARRALLFWCLFVGVGAVAGAVGMLVAPDGSALGMQTMLPAFQVLPFADILFQDFVFPGISLLIVNGLSNLTAAALILRKKLIGVKLGMAFGVTLMLWIVIQFIIFPFNVLSTAYFVFGIIQAATGYAALVFRKQELFAARGTDERRIGADDSRLVVYFSRMGYVRRAALEAANETGAQVYEIKTTERTAGTAGFWWCGRFGLKRMEMDIEPIAVELERYAHVTICSPVWVFSLAAPVRRFCRLARGKIASADYLLVHFNRAPYKRVAREMDGLLGLGGTRVKSLCCRMGKYQAPKTFVTRA